MLKRLAFLCILIVLSLTGCGTASDGSNSSGDKSNDESEPGMIGYVVAKEGERILVVESEAQDFSSTGGISEFYNAIMFSNVPKDIEIGEKVKVWFDIVAESYPGQSAATKIEVIQTKIHDGAS